jgi:hypothetical protein
VGDRAFTGLPTRCARDGREEARLRAAIEDGDAASIRAYLASR